MDEPRSGSVRVNGGPWMPCRFTLDGTHQYVDWNVDVDVRGDHPMPGNVTVEIAICPGVSVFGEVVIAEMHVRAGMATVLAVAAGPLRGAR